MIDTWYNLRVAHKSISIHTQSQLREPNENSWNASRRGLGSVACLYVKACGYRILALFTGASKRKMSMEGLGVDNFVDYKSFPGLIDEVRTVPDGGPHVIVVVASVKDPFNQAIQVMTSI